MDMKVSITPHKPGDCGVICMPLQANVPAGHSDWRLTTCPVCGQECWETRKAREVIRDEGLIAACTACALKIGMNKR